MSSSSKPGCGAKKLRYASEFFADLFPGKRAARRRKRFTAGLKELQASLGELNDIVVHTRLSASFLTSFIAHDRPDGQAWKSFTAGRFCGREEARFGSVVKVAARAHRTFARSKPFWD